MSRRSRGEIPNRWLKCPRRAKELIIGKFMAFKTPLSRNFDSKVLPEYRFYPNMLFDICASKKVCSYCVCVILFVKIFFKD